MKATKLLATSTLALAVVSGACFIAQYHTSQVDTLQSEVASKEKAVMEQRKEINESRKIIEDKEKQAQEAQKQAEELKQQLSQMPHLASRGDIPIPSPHKEQGDSGFTEGWLLTYYSLDFESCGKYPGDPGYGVTASGRQVESGVTIAVDPSIIPLGSIVEIMYPDGEVIRKRADDTGGLIRGKHIDVFLNMSHQALIAKGKVAGAKVRVVSPN